MVWVSLSGQAMAQGLFQVSPDKNSRDLQSCLSNHRNLLTAIGLELNEEIRILSRGIIVEKTRNAPKSVIKRYRDVLNGLIFRKILIDDLGIQTARFQARKESIAKNILNTDRINGDLKKKYLKVIAEAGEPEGISAYVWDEFVGTLEFDAAWELTADVFEAIGSGLVMKVLRGTAVKLTAGMVEKALISFASEVLVSTATETILAVLTEPLYGARSTPERMWLDILHEHPELMINPQWMNKAGSPDDPWSTHCFTILRNTRELEKIVLTYVKSSRAEMLQSIATIHRSKMDAQASSGSRSSFLGEMPVAAVADATRVYRPIRLESTLPDWAMAR
jgi:hypothetical protein